MASCDEVEQFLKEFKYVVKQGVINFVTRRDLAKGFISLGITKEIAIEMIEELEVEDYEDGPKKDKDRPGDVWVFGSECFGKEVYIKLKIEIAKEASGKKIFIAKCISFHEADKKLVFPLRERIE